MPEYASQGGCLLPGGVSAPGGGVSAPGGCLLWGVSALGGVCSGGVSAPGGCIPACTEADTPPVNRTTDFVVAGNEENQTESRGMGTRPNFYYVDLSLDFKEPSY